MVVVIGIPNHLHQKLFHYDVDLLVVSFYSVLTPGYPLRVGGLVVDA